VKRLGIAVIGFGWMGQAHSRSYRRIPMLFPDRIADPDLIACADPDPSRAELATASFGFRESTPDWRRAVELPDVDAVVIAAPNMLHLDIIEAATAAGKAVFCEKPVGGTPAHTLRADDLARKAGVITGVGYNYRWAPLVQHARDLIKAGELGTITNYRGRFFSMYGNDPMGLLSWRFQLDQAGHGVSTDLLSHTVDLAHFLVGPIKAVVGITETFISERPLGGGSHYARGAPGDPTGPVTNEDYVGALARFHNGAVATFESSRTLVGPESQHAFEVYGTNGALKWNLERLNELQVYRAADHADTGYTTVFGGDRFPYHGNFVPGAANPIGFEDLIAIEDHEFATAVAKGEPFAPGFAEAAAYVRVQQALLTSVETGAWQEVER
jgi:predicted dehydrogenase